VRGESVHDTVQLADACVLVLRVSRLHTVLLQVFTHFFAFLLLLQINAFLLYFLHLLLESLVSRLLIKVHLFAPLEDLGKHSVFFAVQIRCNEAPSAVLFLNDWPNVALELGLVLLNIFQNRF
jgi:hypothetical protein